MNELPQPTADVRAVREVLLDGLATYQAFAAALDLKTTKQVNEWAAAGMPTVRLGKKPFVVVAPAREWLAEHFAQRRYGKHHNKVAA